MTWQEAQTLIVAIFQLLETIWNGPLGDILREEI
jgi:hypothetical protein